MRSMFSCVFGMVSFNAAAADYPATGMLYNQQEDSDVRRRSLQSVSNLII